jgi:cytochrome P450 PksS
MHWPDLIDGDDVPGVLRKMAKLIGYRSMVFAPGLHHCIGHMLAKMQVTEFFGALTQRFAGAEVLDRELSFMPQIAFRGLYDLNVRVTPRAR